MGVSWLPAATPIPLERRTVTEQGQCDRGGGDSLWKELKLFAALVGLWGILGGFFSISPLPTSPVGQGGKMLSQEVGHTLQPPLWGELCPQHGGAPPAPQHDRRVLSVGSCLLVTVPSTCKNPPLEKSISEDRLWILELKS